MDATMLQQARNRDWEATLRSWAGAPGQTEQTRCENAERMIKEAIADHPRLAQMSIRVFAQGSYCANTNVAQDSDVDVAVCCDDVFFYRLPAGASAPSAFDIGPATITYPDFKAMVGAALVKKFGARGVTPGNKAFDVHENTYRIDADVIPVFEHRRYTGLWVAGTPDYHSGVEFHPDSGGAIINWPDQTHENGVAKNKRTGRRYKAAIRVLKRLRNEMQDARIPAAQGVASFLIESLVWNAPDEHFGHDDYTSMMRAVLASTFNDTIRDETCSEWGEVNELKYLFRAGQPWTRAKAHGFLSAAWDYLGFE